MERMLTEPEGRPYRKWHSRQRRGRCMEHILHLAAKAFIETVCPSPSGRAHGKAATEDHAEDDDDDDEAWAADGDDGDDDDGTDFEAGDVLSKVLGLINQVCGT